MSNLNLRMTDIARSELVGLWDLNQMELIEEEKQLSGVQEHQMKNKQVKFD